MRPMLAIKLKSEVARMVVTSSCVNGTAGLDQLGSSQFPISDCNVVCFEVCAYDLACPKRQVLSWERQVLTAALFGSFR